MMAFAGLGGRPSPRPSRAGHENLGIGCSASYGSTDIPRSPACLLDDPEEKRLTTGRPWPPGVSSGSTGCGEIVSRGPDLLHRLHDAALTASAFDADGWYRTRRHRGSIPTAT